jgi:hypothetical protein
MEAGRHCAGAGAEINGSDTGTRIAREHMLTDKFMEAAVCCGVRH